MSAKNLQTKQRDGIILLRLVSLETADTGAGFIMLVCPVGVGLDPGTADRYSPCL